MSDQTEAVETLEAATCPTHGAFQQRVIDMSFVSGKPWRSRCPECVFAEKAKQVAAEEAEKARLRAGQVTHLLGDSGIPPRFLDRTFDGYTVETDGQRVALSVCRRYVKTFAESRKRGTSLVLTGGPGTGKTHLACAVARAVIEEELCPTWFVTATDMMRRIKDTYRKDSQSTESDVIDALQWHGLLVIDEVGVQKGSEHELMLLFDVLNGRYQNLRPTILMSNLSAEDLEAYLGHRVMDRLRECGTVIAFDWPSHRGRA